MSNKIPVYGYADFVCLDCKTTSRIHSDNKEGKIAKKHACFKCGKSMHLKKEKK